MALDRTRFLWANRGRTSVYKFRVGDDPTIWVWFVHGGGQGSLHTAPSAAPFRADEPLGPAPFPDLGALLSARGTSEAQWREDLLAQFGERIAWQLP